MTAAMAMLTACGGGESDVAETQSPTCIAPITVAAVGDVLLHGPLQRFAANQGNGKVAVLEPV